MQTPQEVLVMRQLLERGWSRRRIAAGLGISRNTLDRYLRLGEWQRYNTAKRPAQLDGHREWLQQQFEQHHGNGWRPSEWCNSPGPQPGVAGPSVRTSGDRLNG
jgi:transposase